LNPSLPARARWLLTAVALWAGGAAAAAGEAGPPAEADRTAKADTIEAARHELRQLQAGREALNVNQSGLPQLAAPEWHGGSSPSTPVPAVAPRLKIAPEARNPNWLVEAMRKPGKPGESSADGRMRELRKDDRAYGHAFGSATDPDRNGERENGSDESRASPERNPGGARPGDSNTAVNPLAAFLDDWMSPQDYALLQPGLATGRSSQVGLPNLALDFGPLTAERPGMAGLKGSVAPVSGLTAAGGPGGPRENPFLQALEPSLTKFPSYTPPSRAIVALPGPAPIPGPVANPVVPSAPTRVPEFARPAADEKLFKPLKRF